VEYGMSDDVIFRSLLKHDVVNNRTAMLQYRLAKYGLNALHAVGCLSLSFDFNIATFKFAERICSI